MKTTDSVVSSLVRLEGGDFSYPGDDRVLSSPLRAPIYVEDTFPAATSDYRDLGSPFSCHGLEDGGECLTRAGSEDKLLMNEDANSGASTHPYLGEHLSVILTQEIEGALIKMLVDCKTPQTAKPNPVARVALVAKPYRRFLPLKYITQGT